MEGVIDKLMNLAQTSPIETSTRDAPEGTTTTGIYGKPAVMSSGTAFMQRCRDIALRDTPITSAEERELYDTLKYKPVKFQFAAMGAFILAFSAHDGTKRVAISMSGDVARWANHPRVKHESNPFGRACARAMEDVRCLEICRFRNPLSNAERYAQVTTIVQSFAAQM